MMYQTTIPFDSGIRAVCLVDPEMPLSRAAPAIRAARHAPPPEPSPQPPQTPHDPEREHLRDVLAGLKDLGQDLYVQQVDRLREMQQAAIELAIAAAAHVIHQQIEANDFPIQSLVRHMVEQLAPCHAVTIYLHPLDLALLKRRSGEDGLPQGPEIRLLADPALQRGDCRAETADLTLLSQLDSNLQALRQQLLHSLPHAEVERRQSHPGVPALGRFPDRRQTA
jgi:hypothetical protein